MKYRNQMKYRIKLFDIMRDVYRIEKRVCWIFWTTVGFGTKDAVQKKADELNSVDALQPLP